MNSAVTWTYFDDLIAFFRAGLTEHADAGLVELERRYRLIVLNRELY
jgi:hypothetical protein